MNGGGVSCENLPNAKILIEISFRRTESSNGTQTVVAIRTLTMVFYTFDPL